MTHEPLYFVYDGECPICVLGASMYTVRQSVGELVTVNAREETDHPVMREINAAGLDLDAGMVLKYQGALYQGDAALHLMAQLGADDHILNALNNRLFQSKTLATCCYPFMRAGRNIALAFKGVGKIRNLTKPSDDRPA